MDLSGPQQAEAIPSRLRSFASELGPKLRDIMVNYEGAWADTFDKFEKCWKDYISYVERRVSSRLANMNLPTVYVHTRIINANLSGAVLSADPLISVKPVPQLPPDVPTDFSEYERKAQAFQHVMNHLNEMSNGRLTLMHQILDGTLYGVVIGKVGWRVEFSETGDSYHPSREYFVNARVSPWDFLADPRCRHVQEAEYSFEVIHATRSMIEQYAKSGFFDRENAAEVDYSSTPGTQSSQYQQNLMEHRKINDVILSSDERCDLVECYCRLDPDENGQKTMWQIVFDYGKRKVLCMRPAALGDGTRPYVVGHLFPATGDMLYGMSIVEVLHALASAKNSLLNQLYDNLKISGNARPLINNNAGLNEVEFMHSAPNAPIHGDDISDGAVRYLQAQPVFQHLLPFVQLISGELQEASSVSSIVQGLKAASTAYATGTLAQQSQQNFDIFVSYFKESFLDPLFTMMGRFTQKYLDSRVAATIRFGTEDVKGWVNRDFLQGEFAIEAQDMRVATKKQQTAQLLMTGLAQAAQAGIQAPYERWLKLWFNYLDVPNVDALFAQENMSYPQQNVQGVPGQPNPNDLSMPAPQAGASRLQMRPGPMGEMPPMGELNMPSGGFE